MSNWRGLSSIRWDRHICIGQFGHHSFHTVIHRKKKADTVVDERRSCDRYSICFGKTSDNVQRAFARWHVQVVSLYCDTGFIVAVETCGLRLVSMNFHVWYGLISMTRCCDVRFSLALYSLIFILFHPRITLIILFTPVRRISSCLLAVWSNAGECYLPSFRQFVWLKGQNQRNLREESVVLKDHHLGTYRKQMDIVQYQKLWRSLANPN